MREKGLIYFILIVSTLLAMSCTESVNHYGKTPLVEVDGRFLYQEDLTSVLPSFVNKTDSTTFVDKYIHNWIEEVLLFDKAEGNIPDNKDIERLVASYRKTLIMHVYQEELLNQEIGTTITEEEVADYYKTHSEMFRAEQPLIKGLFVKVPLNAPHLNNVRIWYKSNNQLSIDRLEKYTVSNAVLYDYFYNDWKRLNTLLAKLPMKKQNSDYSYFEKNRNVEVADTAYHYFLHIEELLPEGDILPIEYAETEIKEILINLKRVDYINKMRHDLYDDALEKKQIIYY